MKYKVQRIQSDMFRIYPNRRQGGYDVKSIHTTVPRMCRNIDEAVRTMNILLDLKHEVLPGAFMNRIKRNHPNRIYIKDREDSERFCIMDNINAGSEMAAIISARAYVKAISFVNSEYVDDWMDHHEWYAEEVIKDE